MPDLPDITTADLRLRMDNLAHKIDEDLRRIDSLEADLRRLQALLDDALSPPRPRPNPHCPTTLTVRPYMRAATGHLKRLDENITITTADAEQFPFTARLLGWPETRIWWQSPTASGIGIAQ